MGSRLRCRKICRAGIVKDGDGSEDGQTYMQTMRSMRSLEHNITRYTIWWSNYEPRCAHSGGKPFA